MVFIIVICIFVVIIFKTQITEKYGNTVKKVLRENALESKK